MQDESTKLQSEQEIIELPEERSEVGQQSALARALLGTALLLVGGGATYSMYFRNSAQASAAVATDGLAAAMPSDTSRLSEFLAKGQGELPALRAVLVPTESIPRSMAGSVQHIQVPLSALRCNPFREPIPPAPAGHAPPPAAASDTQHQQQAQRAAMLQAVEAMQLQSITNTDSHRSCMINDVLYVEGGIIHGFTIEQIDAQTVVIRNGLYRFELTMNR